MEKEITLSQARIGLLSHVSEEELGGGIGRFIQHLKLALPQLEIFPKSDWLGNHFWARKKINPWYLDWLKNDCVYSRRLKKEHRLRPFDLLFTHSCTGIRLNSKKMGIPVIHLYFGCLEEFVRRTVASRWDRFVQIAIAGRMDRQAGKNKYCTVLSDKVQEEIKEIYAQESHVIRVGVDLEIAKNYERSQARVKLGGDPFRENRVVCRPAGICQGPGYSFEIGGLLSGCPIRMRHRRLRFFSRAGQFDNPKKYFIDGTKFMVCGGRFFHYSEPL